MSLFVSLAVLVFLASCELLAGPAVDGCGWRVVGVAWSATLCPSWALFQLWREQRWRGSSSPIKRPLESQKRWLICGWAATCVAVIAVFRWHDVVRQNWGLANSFLVDELLILTPVLVSSSGWLIVTVKNLLDMMGCESIPRDNGQNARQSQPKYRLFEQLRQRLARRNLAVMLRLQLWSIGLPIGLAIVVNDWTYVLTTIDPNLTVGLVVILLVGTLLILPTMMQLIFACQPPTELARATFDRETGGQSVRPALKVWTTGNLFVNASAVGVLPWFRQLWISDQTQAFFPPSELAAIFRHELTHLRHGHQLQRLVIVFSPLAVWAIAGWWIHGDPNLVTPVAAYCQISPVATAICLSFLYAMYVLAATQTFSHAIEFEADAVACCQQSPGDDGIDQYHWNFDRKQSLISALRRLAAYSASDRESLFHPSLRQRITFLSRQSTAAQIGVDQLVRRNRRRWWLSQVSVASLLWAVVVLLPL